MENKQPPNWIKVGFLIGIGLIIPSILTYILGSVVLIKGIPAFMRHSAKQERIAGNKELVNNYMSDSDRTSQIEITSHREQPMDGPVLILGTLKNNGKTKVGSVHLEVELLDKNMQMVYECSEYISHKIKSGAQENFQVKCGCGNTAIPQHDSYTIRVTKASSY